MAVIFVLLGPIDLLLPLPRVIPSPILTAIAILVLGALSARIPRWSSALLAAVATALWVVQFRLVGFFDLPIIDLTTVILPARIAAAREAHPVLYPLYDTLTHLLPLIAGTAIAATLSSILPTRTRPPATQDSANYPAGGHPSFPAPHHVAPTGDTHDLEKAKPLEKTTHLPAMAAGGKTQAETTSAHAAVQDRQPRTRLVAPGESFLQRHVIWGIVASALVTVAVFFLVLPDSEIVRSSLMGWFFLAGMLVLFIAQRGGVVVFSTLTALGGIFVALTLWLRLSLGHGFSNLDGLWHAALLLVVVAVPGLVMLISGTAGLVGVLLRRTKPPHAAPPLAPVPPAQPTAVAQPKDSTSKQS
ncbi:hypothetical protein [Corynebacterium aquilae]|nr:hypothetical protein [Corynebacterium aquilae]